MKRKSDKLNNSEIHQFIQSTSNDPVDMENDFQIKIPPDEKKPIKFDDETTEKTQNIKGCLNRKGQQRIKLM